MNGYESSPSTSAGEERGERKKKKEAEPDPQRRGTPLCLFFFSSKFPKKITRNQSGGGLIDRQELHRVNEEVALCSFLKGWAMPTQP